MNMTMHNRLFRRELAPQPGAAKVRQFYGDRTWINRLDIVHQLDGHTGCVNALSWAKAGNLLASGSDDQHVNIHSYQAADTDAPFRLTTSIATGHRANIFSVKFMPHSGDRTIISAAGDAEIRIFDIEYSGRTACAIEGTTATSAHRARGLLENGVRYLDEGNTNARVYRSHSDRVKRIVTESSPHLFLSCSEDGEVRQWDLRQPSSAYPRPRGARGWSSVASDNSSNVPPPLISYKRWRLDLNTISCSPSQPHYIALGGAHLHAFLHDRRMLGRDLFLEAGSPGGHSKDKEMAEATKCVRRFAPNGQKKMKPSQNGHITACKISDANPNEMIASWSGDWIYSFDLVRSPDATSYPSAGSNLRSARGQRSRHSSERKRKRTSINSGILHEVQSAATPKARRTSVPTQNPSDQITLRVHYGNGQTEDIAMNDSSGESPFPLTVETVLTDLQRQARRIAQVSVQIRKCIFSLDATQAHSVTDEDPTGYARAFRAALRMSSSILLDIDKICQNWAYPLNPTEDEIMVHNTLRRNRESARRFIQAAGTIGRLLAGRISNDSRNFPAAMQLFNVVSLAPNEVDILDPSEQFSYDLVKAIILWLDSGPGAVLEGFTKQGRFRSSSRFPIEEDASIEAIDETLIPYLLDLATEQPIPNVDASRFEHDETRNVFATEKHAVVAFAAALRMPFEDLSSISESPVGAAEGSSPQSRKTALRFWGLKVARGLLMNACAGCNYVFVDRAFGGLGQVPSQIRDAEGLLMTQHEQIATDNADDMAFDLPHVARPSRDEEQSDDILPDEHSEGISDEEPETDEEEHEDEGDDEEDDEDDEDDEDEPDEDDDDDPRNHFIFRSALSRSAERARVNEHVPCSSHLREYRGHCNVKTVKDVNFFGLRDEYVVSGSDSGHVFIWSRATGQLVNILEGDGEVVNVVQAHPYEPMLAVSGIDNTVKIFSPDARARADARRGVHVTGTQRHGRPAPNPRRLRRHGPSTEPAMPQPDDADADADSDAEAVPLDRLAGLASARRMDQEYKITSQNDVDRRGGNRDAFITQSMLAQLAARMRVQRAAAAGLAAAGGGATAGAAPEGTAHREMEDEAGLGDGPLVIRTDDCAIM